MQWVKPFWEQNYPGGEYDAVGRRKGAPTAPTGVANTTTRTAAAASTTGRVSSASKRATKTPGKINKKKKKNPRVVKMLTQISRNGYP